MTSQKQIKANKKNALKGGVKTKQGKDIVKFNALKHGLLSKATVITTGDGTESIEEYELLLNGLIEHFKPLGTMEEMLVEKIAVSYWRLRRANYYEVGLIRKELDNYKNYDKTDIANEKLKELIDEKLEIESLLIVMDKMKDEEKKELTNFYSQKWRLAWHCLALDLDEKNPLHSDWAYKGSKEIHQIIIESYHTPNINDLWLQLNIHHSDIISEIEIQKNRIREIEYSAERETMVKGLIPEKELLKLMRYEASIERQFYKALNQLERTQRMRIGETIPAPISLDISMENNQ